MRLGLVHCVLQMGDLTLLPDGTAFLCNGAKTGKLSHCFDYSLLCEHFCAPVGWQSEFLCGTSSVN